MTVSSTDPHEPLRAAVRDLCSAFEGEYWRRIDEERGYPEAFIKALEEAGWLGALIPEEYGGSGVSLTEASIILEEINRSGGNSGYVHAQMYTMGTVLRHGSEEQKRRSAPDAMPGR